MKASIDTADALARGLAQQVQRWALARGAAAPAAWAAAGAARALSLAMGDGHVCVWLADLPALTDRLADLPALTARLAGAPCAGPLQDPAAADHRLPTTDADWRALLQASAVVGSAAEPANQPLVLDADGRLYLHRQFDLERRLARRLLQGLPTADAVHAMAQTDNAATATRLQSLFGARPGDPADWQMLAAALALHNRLTVISGGPGTGKTTTVVNLLACLLAEAPDTRVVLAAPTGKAAARLAEALRSRAAHLDDTLRARLPTSATTVHRLLGVRPGRGGLAGAGEQAFQHDAAHPLPLDLLVLDEASMLDLALATRLLDAVPLHARVVLLGDKDQLAAVESGAVFAELSADPRLSVATTARLAALCGLQPAQITPPAPVQPGPLPDGLQDDRQDDRPSALPDSVVWFQRNFRFARDSGIGRLAADTLSGDPAAVLATLRAPADGALGWLDDAAPRPAPATVAAAAAGHAAYATACRQALAAGPLDAAAHAALHAAFGRFRVLCALRDGPRGVVALNDLLSRRLRADIAGLSGDATAPDGMADPRQPWYPGRPVMVLRNDPALRLFNGDIGLTLPAHDGALQVVFPTADGGWRAVAPARLPAHETAWAMTVHKSQGSEFDAVLLLLPAQPSRVLSRELLYTGITRARHRVQLAAGSAVLAAAVRAGSQRHAGLQARLRETLAAHASAGWQVGSAGG